MAHFSHHVFGFVAGFWRGGMNPNRERIVRNTQCPMQFD